MSEIWEDIAGFEGEYQVSTMGLVRSMPRLDTRGHRWKGKPIAPGRNALGHRSVMLYRGGAYTKFWIHQLVLQTFVGPPRSGQEACQLNGRASDNRLANLTWGTHRQNTQHQYLHGTNPVKGSRSPHARYNDIDIERVLDLRAGGASISQISRWTGVGFSTTYKIIIGKRA